MEPALVLWKVLSLAAQLIDSNSAKYVVAAASSHNAAAEKQFRYPTEYGVQRPPTAQWTVTGAVPASLVQMVMVLK